MYLYVGVIFNSFFVFSDFCFTGRVLVTLDSDFLLPFFKLWWLWWPKTDLTYEFKAKRERVGVIIYR